MTGGSGFLGSALIRALNARGVKVTALARSDAASTTAVASGADSVCRGDISDVDAMQRGMQGCTYAYHCAAFVDDWGNRADAIKVNVDGTANVLKAAKAAGIKRVVHVSTEAVLATGNPIVNANETTPIPWGRHIGIYPETKAMAEDEVRKAVEKDGVDAVIVRPRFIWGPGSNVSGRIVEGVRLGKWVWVNGGNSLFSTCHVDNVIEGMLLAAEKGKAGEAYFLTDGPPKTQREVVSAFLSTEGVAVPSGPNLPLWLLWAVAGFNEWKARVFGGHPIPSRTAVGLMFVEVTVDDAKARRELGYVGEKGWEQGIQELRDVHARSAPLLQGRR